MQRIPVIIFLIAIAITVPSMIIFYSPVNGEQEIDPEPTNCEVGMSSVDRILCKKLDKIAANQELMIELLNDIYDMGS